MTLLLCTPAHAVFFKGIRFRHHNHPERALYSLPEYHAGTRKALQQLEELLQCARAKKSENQADGDDPTGKCVPFIISEDAWALPPASPSVARFIEQEKEAVAERQAEALAAGERGAMLTMTVLKGLTDKVRHAGCDGISADFRQYSMMCSAGTELPSKKQIHQELMHQVATIGAYKDCSLFDRYYKKTVAQFQKEHRILLNAKTPLKTIVAGIRNDDRIEKDLINARILHAIYQNRQRTTLIVCFGGGHLEDIQPILEEFGYQRELVVGQSLHAIEEEIYKKLSSDDDDKRAASADDYQEREREKTKKYHALVCKAAVRQAIDIRALFTPEPIPMPGAAAAAAPPPSSSSSLLAAAGSAAAGYRISPSPLWLSDIMALLTTTSTPEVPFHGCSSGLPTSTPPLPLPAPARPLSDPMAMPAAAAAAAAAAWPVTHLSSPAAPLREPRTAASSPMPPA